MRFFLLFFLIIVWIFLILAPLNAFADSLRVVDGDTIVDFAEKNCENYTRDIYEKVSSDLGSGFVFKRMYNN